MRRFGLLVTWNKMSFTLASEKKARDLVATCDANGKDSWLVTRLSLYSGLTNSNRKPFQIG